MASLRLCTRANDESSGSASLCRDRPDIGSMDADRVVESRNAGGLDCRNDNDFVLGCCNAVLVTGRVGVGGPEVAFRSSGFFLSVSSSETWSVSGAFGSSCSGVAVSSSHMEIDMMVKLSASMVSICYMMSSRVSSGI